MMLRTLLESQARPTRRGGGTAFSVAVHTAMIGTAIVATARATTRAPAPPLPPVVYRIPVSPAPAHGMATTTVRRCDMCITFRNVLVPPVNIPVVHPAIDASQPTTRASDFTGAAVSLGAGIATGSPGGAERGSLFTPATVEKAAMPLADNPAPRYPASLRASSIEGIAVARFVVDTMGRAEPQSIAIVSTTHPLFGDAVKEALLHSRYLPAMVGGRAVRQLVEQRFSFTLTR